MKFHFKGDWKYLLILAGLVLGVLLIVGSIFSFAVGFLVFILKGLGYLVSTILRFAFSSITGLVVLVAVAYLGYLGYDKLKKSPKYEKETIEYTNEDFER